MAMCLMRLAVAGIFALIGLNCQDAAADSENTLLPVPAMTLYPGDLITDQSLVDREFPADSAMSRLAGARTRADLVGKVARRTLLPGQPISMNAVGKPTIVAAGGKVQIVYEDGGLRITAFGIALQSGSAGDIISARNSSSGLTISGTMQADGTLCVGGS
jgi:flagellar basal body P-ring formation protein FlgA